MFTTRDIYASGGGGLLVASINAAHLFLTMFVAIFISKITVIQSNYQNRLAMALGSFH